jgi:peptidoglycan/LPS O-acetylase OafA/YrhL
MAPFTLALPAAAAATLLSFRLIERPCLRLKKRFHRLARADGRGRRSGVGGRRREFAFKG